jgi:hypothetical protein
MSRRTVDFIVFHVCAASGVYFAIEAFRGAHAVINGLGVI